LTSPTFLSADGGVFQSALLQERALKAAPDYLNETMDDSDRYHAGDPSRLILAMCNLAAELPEC
jgi:hypothetical protein